MINWEIEKKEKEKGRKLMTPVGAIEASRICPRDADHTVGVIVHTYLLILGLQSPDLPPRRLCRLHDATNVPPLN